MSEVPLYQKSHLWGGRRGEGWERVSERERESETLRETESARGRERDAGLGVVSCGSNIASA